jgi:protein-S-isoprenylcysteine O-methyltransferase Ste14
MQLVGRILRSTVIGLLVLGLLIFVPAGSLAYWRGWAFVAVFIVSNIIIGVYLALADPALLARRKKVGPAAEQRLAQKIIISALIAIFLVLVVFSAIDWRFGWSSVPAWVSVLGDALVALGLMIDLRVLRDNTYAASTIEKMEDQQVITTGLYGVVRHPMYAGVLVMAAGVPLALGSWWGLFFSGAIVPVLMFRILDEEKMLRAELPGYEAYARDVRYRLLPGLW